MIRYGILILSMQQWVKIILFNLQGDNRKYKLLMRVALLTRVLS